MKPHRCARDRLARLALAGLLGVAGCGPAVPLYSPPPAPYTPWQGVVNNPTLVPVRDPEFTWDQIVDVVDDHFKIEREQRPRLAGELLTDGRIDTFPRPGSTIFEPWNYDSVTAYDRLESTLQTIRRTAFIVVKPAEGGYLIDVAVLKELEDAAKGRASFIGEEAPVNEIGRTGSRPFDPQADDEQRDLGLGQPLGIPAFSAGWIPLGRDRALEQQIISQLNARLGALPLLPEPTPTPQLAPVQPYY